MSVVERELTQIEAPITEREQRARTLEAAALEIDVRGWMKGNTWHDQFGERVCMLGAVACAKGLSREDWSQAVTLKTYGDDSEQAWIWNDESADDAEQVKFVLRWRAAEIRDGL